MSDKMECDLCKRPDMTEREVGIHKKYYHKIGVDISENITSPPAISEQPQRIAGGVCPECGSTLFYQEGCTSCQQCGFSRCG